MLASLENSMNVPWVCSLVELPSTRYSAELFASDSSFLWYLLMKFGIFLFLSLFSLPCSCEVFIICISVEFVITELNAALSDDFSSYQHIYDFSFFIPFSSMIVLIAHFMLSIKDIFCFFPIFKSLLNTFKSTGLRLGSTGIPFGHLPALIITFWVVISFHLPLDFSRWILLPFERYKIIMWKW